VLSWASGFGAEACACCSSTFLLSHPRDMRVFYAANMNDERDLRQKGVDAHLEAYRDRLIKFRKRV
jgi:hypothetical protein